MRDGGEQPRLVQRRLEGACGEDGEGGGGGEVGDGDLEGGLGPGAEGGGGGGGGGDVLGRLNGWRAGGTERSGEEGGVERDR